jgi:hypothetical protein
MRHAARAWIAVTIFVFSSFVSSASAQAPGSGSRDPAAAEILFNKGLELLKKGDWAGACPQFDASMKLDPSVGAQINIARCAEHNGLVARAWAEYQKARVLNAETPGEQRQKDIATFLEQELAKLEPRIPWVTIKVSARPSGLRIERDGISLPLEGLDQAVPIDPGRHTFAASAPGYAPTQKYVDLAEGARKEVVLELVRDDAAAPSTPTSPAPPPVPTPTVASESDGSTLVVIGAILGSVGGASLIVSAVTGGIALSDRGTLDDLVATGSCTEQGESIVCADGDARNEAQSAASRGETLALASTVTLFAGAALAATGVTLIIVGATQGSEPSTVEAALVPIYVDGGLGLGVRGAF